MKFHNTNHRAKCQEGVKKKKGQHYMLGLLEKKKNNNYITITNLNIGKMNINMNICIFFFLLKAAGHILHFAK